MTEIFAKDLQDKHIRIEAAHGQVYLARVIDLGTGQVIENVKRVQIDMDIDKDWRAIKAIITLGHVDSIVPRHITCEEVTIDNPNMDIIAVVGQVEDGV